MTKCKDKEVSLVLYTHVKALKPIPKNNKIEALTLIMKKIY